MESFKLITRKEAREQGLTHYFTGKPCKNGNLAQRGVTSPQCQCRDCRDERNAGSRAWRAAHPDRQAAACRSWQERNWEAQQEVWRRAEAAKKQRAQSDPQYKERRAEQGRQRSLAYHHRNYGVDAAYTERVKANSAHQKVVRRRAKAATVLSAEEMGQVKAVYRLRYTLSRETGAEYHVDHHIPLSRGGKHHPDNLWVVPAAENLRKGSKLPSEL